MIVMYNLLADEEHKVVIPSLGKLLLRMEGKPKGKRKHEGNISSQTKRRSGGKDREEM